jgi:glycosyltransferase involved in cell wall biosynthesis
MILGINASRARSGGARAHLIGILSEGDPPAQGIDAVHVWSYGALLDALPDRPWLFKHRTPALEKSLVWQVLWERFSLTGALRRAGCNLLLNLDAGTVSRFRPAITMSQDMLSYEPGELRRLRLGKAWLRVWLLRIMQNRSLRAAQGSIFLTRYAAGVIQQSCGPLANQSLIPHGVGETFRQAAPRAAWPVAGNRPIRCLYVSPVWLFKHQWVTVRAIKHLRQRGHDVVLTLAGDGDADAKALLAQQIAESDPEGSIVTRLGHVPHGELPSVLAAADIFVFASSCENMPITVLEAMAVGMPIACSNRGPMPEVLADGGVYFDPENDVAIANAVEELIKDIELRERISSRAHELASAYSWTRCARETFAFAFRTHALVQEGG